MSHDSSLAFDCIDSLGFLGVRGGAVSTLEHASVCVCVYLCAEQCHTGVNLNSRKPERLGVVDGWHMRKDKMLGKIHVSFLCS